MGENLRHILSFLCVQSLIKGLKLVFTAEHLSNVTSDFL